MKWPGTVSPRYMTLGSGLLSGIYIKNLPKKDGLKPGSMRCLAGRVLHLTSWLQMELYRGVQRICWPCEVLKSRRMVRLAAGGPHCWRISRTIEEIGDFSFMISRN